MNGDRRIVCVDFNGVLDTDTGWQGPDHFDPPRPGARAFLEPLKARGLRVAAHVFVDDRAVCFRGDFGETLREIDRFSAHWEPPI
jgi:hypothetical protein